MRLSVVHSTELDRWIAERHYLHSTPAGAIVRKEFLSEDGCRLGAMMWGRPVAPQADQAQLLELTRMYFIEDTEHCIESRALAMARKYIRKHHPQVKGLLAYSSLGEGHKGTVYWADGWFVVSKARARSKGWASREGRADRDLSPKLKFMRSP